MTIALAVAGVALMPAPAYGHAKAKTKVLRGEFDFVGADGDYVTGKFGQAQLVDGRRNDKLSVHVRRLGARQSYTFRLLQSARACEENAPAGTPVAGWTYRHGGVLTTSRKGVANSTARSHTFRIQRGVAYSVGVYTSGGELVLCAALEGKRHHHSKPKRPAHSHHGKPQPEGNGRGKKEERDHGRPVDTPRGRGPR